jgi:hypothetical protein
MVPRRNWENKIQRIIGVAPWGNETSDPTPTNPGGGEAPGRRSRGMGIRGVGIVKFFGRFCPRHRLDGEEVVGAIGSEWGRRVRGKRGDAVRQKAKQIGNFSQRRVGKNRHHTDTGLSGEEAMQRNGGAIGSKVRGVG